MSIAATALADLDQQDRFSVAFSASAGTSGISHGAFTLETQTVALHDIERAWTAATTSSRRLVVLP